MNCKRFTDRLFLLNFYEQQIQATLFTVGKMKPGCMIYTDFFRL
ncbi:hypothetical protein CCAND93_730010 [Capnocytophaga canis]|uniref:Uncharacterized protein n=1 Tax=Capnocytophaga canis TaxID=1848903 RepID=A0A0B7IQF6_9FLAO|nr:hypothetical protein CCAND93_730010 [Capnocytophaga canis]